MRKRILKTAALLICALGLLAGKAEYTVYAKTEQSGASFSGDVTMLKQENHGYVMQVTVENSGEDFTGTVQLIFASENSANCAYTTEITLPAQGKKQFTINAADTAVDTSQGLCALHFLDGKGNLRGSIELKNVFHNTMTEIPTGVLSDNYAGLAFLEAKGETFNIQNGKYPLKLLELNEDNLMENLDSIYFLIIDQYDVSSLGRENIETVQDWVKKGGHLMIGTGAYAEQTLSGFDADFLDVRVSDITEPGEENVISVNAGPYGYYYYMYTNDGIDFTNVAAADLSYSRINGDFYESTENPAICGPLDAGTVLVFYCALGEEEFQKLSRYTVTQIYEELLNGPYGYQSDNYSEWGYIRQRALNFIDYINTNLDFTSLRAVIILYVFLAGPVLYLILRKCKKCEWYWLSVPVLGILFIAVIYFAGQGARVNDAVVYSVTVQKADSSHKETYFMAYHSGTKPWEVQLNESYETAGPGSRQSRYYYGGYSGTDDYYYMVGSGSEGLRAGIKPEENFDSGFFFAEGSSEPRGTLFGENLTDIGNGRKIGGTVTNGTDCDMAYMAVWFRDVVMVFSDVKAGETIDLEQAEKGGRCVLVSDSALSGDLFYEMVPMYSYRMEEAEYEADDMAALLIGLGTADLAKPAASEPAVIAGVVRDYDKMTEGRCSEISYGCLYAYAEMEGGQNAAD